MAVIEEEKTELEIPCPRSPAQALMLDFLIAFSRLGWNTKVRGREFIPEKEPFIICANHESHMDGFWIVSFLKRAFRKRLCIIGKRQHFEFFLSKIFINLLGGIPVDREGDPAPALEISLKALKDSRCVLIHPEGTRTRTGELGVFREGAAWLSIKTGVPVLPAAVIGAYKIFPYNRRLPSMFNWKKLNYHKLTVRFGEVICPGSGETAKELTARIREAIIKLQRQGSEK